MPLGLSAACDPADMPLPSLRRLTGDPKVSSRSRAAAHVTLIIVHSSPPTVSSRYAMVSVHRRHLFSLFGTAGAAAVAVMWTIETDTSSDVADAGAAAPRWCLSGLGSDVAGNGHAGAELGAALSGRRGRVAGSNRGSIAVAAVGRRTVDRVRGEAVHARGARRFGSHRPVPHPAARLLRRPGRVAALMGASAGTTLALAVQRPRNRRASGRDRARFPGRHLLGARGDWRRAGAAPASGWCAVNQSVAAARRVPMALPLCDPGIAAVAAEQP